MNRLRTFTAGMTLVMLSHSVAFADFEGQVRQLRARLDSGSLDGPTAVESFATALAGHPVSIENVEAYAKRHLTAREFQMFRAEINAMRRGLDESVLAPEELGEFIGQALSRVSSTGLAWSGCEPLAHLGLLIVVSGVVAAVISTAGDGSSRAVRERFERSRTSTNQSFGDEIALRQDWRVRLPDAIREKELEIAENQRQAELYLARGFEVIWSDAETGDFQTARELSANYSRLVIEGRASLNEYLQLLNRYQLNPERALIDIADFEARRDAQIAELGSAEERALRNAAGWRRLRWGGGVGALLGVGLTFYGAREDVACRN